ncbi:SEC14-like protein 2 [Nephila pilipes]|uniref:SEC14-like protein 2 n=1 Tax=Nephila pilipes TaxID=299642 RepID=A0A8X6J0A3_NEPPI|nr:SEC14-like protein 2 [Nephila pilipes]
MRPESQEETYGISIWFQKTPYLNKTMSLIRKIPSFQDITEDEKNVVEELRRRTFDDLTPKMQEDESVFYRFCKARNFDLNEAEIMLRKHIVWAKEIKLDTFMTHYKRPEVISKYYSYGFICNDKEGRTVMYVDFGNMDAKGLWNSAKESDGLNSGIFDMERDLVLLNEHNKKLGKHFTKLGYIYNLKNLSFSTATNMRGIESMLRFYKMHLDNYPERMKYIYIINAPVYYTIFFTFFKTILSSEIMEKLRFFGSEGWKEGLLEIIDADELPAFLGGNKTDPDGNPLCKTFVKHLEPVPEKYYFSSRKKLLSKSSYFRKLTVLRSSMEEIRFKIAEQGSVLEWEFETKNRDIGFMVYFNSSEDCNPVEVVPKQRVDTFYGPERNSIKCENLGIYTIVFDNSYSWMHSKDVFYRVRVRGPNDDEKKQ